MIASTWTAAIAALALQCGGGNAAGVCGQSPGDLRVMTFNIRYGTANDGENHWQKRKEFLVETIAAFNPDLLGTQETLAAQRDYLAEQLKVYEAFAAGRDDGKDGGEMAALYFRRERFEKTAGGHFWLSERPDQVGSKGWDAALPRIATWVKLIDRRCPDLPPVFFVNVHFDHRGSRARLESAKLLRRMTGELGRGCRIVVTGDFNAGEDSPPYKALFNDQPDSIRLFDAYRAAHPVREKNEGTFSGFDAAKISGPRIDWIAYSGDWQAMEASIDRTQRNGRTPSDHFPVSAVLRPVAGGN